MNEKKDTKQLRLLAIGTSNWNYYLETKVEKRQNGLCSTNLKEILVNSVWYIAKPGSGCNSGWFGDIRHFKNIYRKNRDMSLSNLGEKIIFQGFIPTKLNI